MDMRLGEVRCCYCKLYFKPECQRRQTRKGKKQYMALCPRCGNEMIILKKNGFGNAQTLPVE